MQLNAVGAAVAGIALTMPSLSAGDPDRLAPPTELSAKHFSALHALIRPQPNEARWLDIPWEIDVWRARKRAAAEGKPIFFLTGGGKSPLGDC
jgi:hypothetical protein